MRAISWEEMQALDANCQYFGLLPLQLMENAGAAIAREVAAISPGKRIAIVAGRGNNGGDAFVAARHLAGFAVTVYLLGRSRDIYTEVAKRNWEILERLHWDLREVRDAEELNLIECDLIVDAIFGTGVKGRVAGLEASAIDAINSSGKRVLSVDIPSGLGTKVVRADSVVTFHRLKPSLGDGVIVADIGIPPEAELFVGPGDLKLVGSRSQKSHKGDSGRILVIGGGPYTGAPALTALAALRAGADIVTVAAPGRAAKTIAGFSPNLIVRELSGDHLNSEDLPALQDLIASHDVVVMGMGLGRHPDTRAALASIIPLAEKVVIDADALLPGLPLKGIVTPHAGEFQRISGISLQDLEYKERTELAKGFARERGITVLLKGKVDLITDGEVMRANTTGNPGMTVGGTGDVLAGIVAAFYARTSALRAASAAAFVNGRAGDLVYLEKGFGMLATDLVESIPLAMRI